MQKTGRRGVVTATDRASLPMAVLVEPSAEEGHSLVSRVNSSRFQLVPCTDSLRALAKVGRDQVFAVVASAHLESVALARLVQVVRAETGLPVLLAHGPGDITAISGAIMAGARPVLSLPYRPLEVVRALESAVPEEERRQVVEVGDLMLVPDWFDAQFRGRGRSVEFSRLEFEIVLELAIHAGHVIPRDHLASRLWPSNQSSNALLLNAAVKRIRHKLHACGANEAVRTVRAVGYRLDPAALGCSEQALFGSL